MPWISRETLALIRAQLEAQQALNEWMRAELANAYRHERTIERAERNLPEREAQPRKPEEEIPEGIMQLVRLHPPIAQEGLLGSIREARRQVPPVTWQELNDSIRSTFPERLLATLNPIGEGS